jgi:hypothetical protein
MNYDEKPDVPIVLVPSAAEHALNSYLIGWTFNAGINTQIEDCCDVRKITAGCSNAAIAMYLKYHDPANHLARLVIIKSNIGK